MFFNGYTIEPLPISVVGGMCYKRLEKSLDNADDASLIRLAHQLESKQGRRVRAL